MKKILTVSIMAVMAVTAANAEIASKAYVDNQRDAAKDYTDTKIGTYTGAAEGATTVAQAIALAVSGGTKGVVTRSGTEAVGSATVPVYVNASGVVTPTSLGSMATENAADYTKTGLDTTYAKQTDFTTLQSAVNNAETGLAATKAIADANKTAIGDASSGLTKGVADNAAAIAALGNTYATDAELTTGLATKQDTLSEAQLAAANSGITAAKVTTYDGYATTIAGKQDTLSEAQLAAANSGITAAKVTTYDGYATTIAGKQDTLSEAQLAAANSGITAAKVSTYDTTASAVSNAETGLAATKAIADEAKATADAAIPAPTAECTNLGAKCVLTVGTGGVYAWEVVQRGTGE